MKQLLILLLSVSLLVACNNDKKTSTRNTETESKDDYRNNGNEKSNEGDEKGTIDRNSGQNDDVVDDDEEGNHVADGANWSNSDITGFTTQCEKTAMKNGASLTQAQTYCNCMLRKLTTKYPDINDIDKNGPDIKEMASECEASITKNSSPSTSKGWTRAQELQFVNTCIQEAKKSGMKDELDAQSYCDCMQYKIEKIYPSYADANRLTEADLKKPSMQKMIEDCLPGN